MRAFFIFLLSISYLSVFAQYENNPCIVYMDDDADGISERSYHYTYNSNGDRLTYGYDSE